MSPGSLCRYILATAFLTSPLLGESPPLKPRPESGPDPYYLALPGEGRVFQGEAVVWMEDDDQVLVAIDVAGASRRDGRVDHVFSFRSAGPMPRLDLVRDASARVEDRGGQLSVVLPSERQIFYFVLEGTRPLAFLVGEEDLAARTFGHGVEIARYSDDASNRVALEDIVREGENALSSAAGTLIGPYFLPPALGPDGGSCQASCSIDVSRCAGGSCSSNCAPGFCARCECIVGGYPSCRCGR